MHKALELKKEAKDGNLPHIPCERTVYRLMERLGIVHTPKRKPNGITKADSMKAGLCVDILKSAIMAYPGLRGAIIHFDRGSQFGDIS